MEAAPGFEPGIKVLQTSALPLGYAAFLISLFNSAIIFTLTDYYILFIYNYIYILYMIYNNNLKTLIQEKFYFDKSKLFGGIIFLILAELCFIF